MRTSKNKTQTAIEFMDQTMEEMAQVTSSLKLVTSDYESQKLVLDSQFSPQITVLETQRELIFDKMQLFATENASLIFTTKRSYDTQFGIFGFRMGQPHFSLVGKTTWTMILKKLKEFLPEYVKITEAPSKSKMMADVKKPLIANMLPFLGLTVDQEDKFFIDVA